MCRGQRCSVGGLHIVDLTDSGVQQRDYLPTFPRLCVIEMLRSWTDYAMDLEFTTPLSIHCIRALTLSNAMTSYSAVYSRIFDDDTPWRCKRKPIAVITIAIRLRYDYDPTTTYRTHLLPFDAILREQKMNMSIFVVVVS